MANYSILQQAIDAGISNMTVLRNNSKNDDGTTTYATGIDWFKFNNVTVSNIYSSGNSWIGLGVSSEQLKVNRRDCAVWYEYKETGQVGIYKFFKFRWVGYSQYNQTSSSYSQAFDMFLFETGHIFLNYYTVPTSNNNGTNALVCGSLTVSYTTTASTPCEFTFTPSDAATGTGWSVSTDRPPVDLPYKPSGNAVFTVSNYAKGGSDTISWTGTTPTGTSLRLYTKVNNGSYAEVTNGGSIPGLPNNGTCTLYVKAELATTDQWATPSLSQIIINSNADKKVLVLTTALPNFSSAVGNMSVSYDGLGGLQGTGGPSEAFTGTFTPSGLTWKGHQNDEEHIEITINPSMWLRLVVYYDTYEEEHAEITITANVVLTDIHDL